MSDWLGEALKRVRGCAALKDNWNSYGAPPIDMEAIDQAACVLLSLSESGVRGPDGIVPTVNATVAFEWHCQNDAIIDVEVHPDGKLDWLDATDEDSDRWTEVVDGDIRDLIDLLKRKE